LVSSGELGDGLCHIPSASCPVGNALPPRTAQSATPSQLISSVVGSVVKSVAHSVPPHAEPSRGVQAAEPEPEPASIGRGAPGTAASPLGTAGSEWKLQAAHATTTEHTEGTDAPTRQ
jgi:hypothetical protein